MDDLTAPANKVVYCSTVTKPWSLLRIQTTPRSIKYLAIADLGITSGTKLMNQLPVVKLTTTGVKAEPLLLPVIVTWYSVFDSSGESAAT